MTWTQYLILMTFGTLVAIIAWIFVLFGMSPDGGIMSFIFFYCTLFASLVGLISIKCSVIRVYFLHRNRPVFQEVTRAFRHAVLFSSVVVGSLILLSIDTFRWWTVLLLVFLISLTEVFWLSKNRTGRKLEQ